MAIDTSKPLKLSQKEIDNIEQNDPKKRKVKVFSFPKKPGSAEVDTFYVRVASRREMEMITETQQKSGISNANDLMINTCVLAGPVALLEDDDALFFGLAKNIASLLEEKKTI
jgi:hypothetical protein